MNHESSYYAVIFTSKQKSGTAGYEDVATRMAELVKDQPGFLGIESARGADGLGITVSYWSDAKSIMQWRKNTEHAEAQAQGKTKFYDSYKIKICKVEREYEF